MKLEIVDIAKIKPDKDQPRKDFDEDALENLEKSIHELGIRKPLEVRENGNGYIIIDGERRYRAAIMVGLTQLPCTVEDSKIDLDEKKILELQLITDCLDESLSVDELDRAIYRLYQLYVSNSTSRDRNSNRDKGYKLIGDKIHKSDDRVRKAIDRFEFKKAQPEFTRQIEQKHNPTKKRFDKVNSTIAMTEPLKNEPEKRKKVIEKILDERKSNPTGLNNEQIKKKIKRIKEENLNDSEIDIVLDDNDKSYKKDPNWIFDDLVMDLIKVSETYSEYKFHEVFEHLNEHKVQKFQDLIKSIYSNVFNRTNLIGE